MHDPALLEKVSARIRALLNLTVERGATEAEALSAAAKAAELMRQYQVTLTDAEIRNDKVTMETFDRASTIQVAPADYCIKGLEKLCGVKMWFHSRWEKPLFGAAFKVRLLAILGAKPDLELAHWLYNMIDDTIERESEEFHHSPLYKAAKEKRSALSSFQVGMAARINERLKDMARSRQEVKTASGTALVVVKDAAINDAFEELGIKLKFRKSGKDFSNTAAMVAGAQTGERVNLNRPVEREHRPHIGV